MSDMPRNVLFTNLCAWEGVSNGPDDVIPIAAPYPLAQSGIQYLENGNNFFPEAGSAGKTCQLTLQRSEIDELLQRNWLPYAWEITGSGAVYMKSEYYAPAAGPWEVDQLIEGTGEYEAIPWNVDGMPAPANKRQPDFTLGNNHRPLWVSGTADDSYVELYPKEGYAELNRGIPFENHTTGERLAFTPVVVVKWFVKAMTPYIFSDAGFFYMGLVAEATTELQWGTVGSLGPLPPGFELFEGSTFDPMLDTITTEYGSMIGKAPAGTFQVRDTAVSAVTWGIVDLAGNARGDLFGNAGFTAAVTLDCIRHYLPPI